MKTILVLLAVVLSSCSYGLRDGLSAMQGKPIQTAFDVIGYPSQKMEFGDKTVYTWSNSTTMMLAMPHSTQTSGLIGSTPYQSTTFGTGFSPTTLNGEVQVVADKAGNIISHDWNGTVGGLQTYDSRLAKYAKQQRKLSQQVADSTP